MTEAEKEILAVLTAYQSTVLAKDAANHAALYDEDLRAFDMWGDWSINSLAGMREMITGWLGSLGTEQVKVGIEEPRITVSGELAVVDAFFTFEAIDPDGKRLRGMANRMTWALRRREAGWRIFHQHSSVPLGPEAKGIFQRQK